MCCEMMLTRSAVTPTGSSVGGSPMVATTMSFPAAWAMPGAVPRTSAAAAAEVVKSLRVIGIKDAPPPWWLGLAPGLNGHYGATGVDFIGQDYDEIGLVCGHGDTALGKTVPLHWLSAGERRPALFAEAARSLGARTRSVALETGLA